MKDPLISSFSVYNWADIDDYAAIATRDNAKDCIALSETKNYRVN
ncbi:hypothetical protein N9195_01020 [bacterium]|nr:hypothetical protein [bacterium]